MQQLAPFYKDWLGFESFFQIQKKNRDPDEFLDHPRYLNGITEDGVMGEANIKCDVGDVHIEVPVWFGDIAESQGRFLVIGLEPSVLDPRFNVEKNGNKVYTTPFGVDRWNVNSSIKNRPQNKYFRTFQEVIDREDVFLVFTTIIKHFHIVSEYNGMNELNARKKFDVLLATDLPMFKEEVKQINPNIIITLGSETYDIVKSVFPEMNVFKVRHPSFGGEKIANGIINELLKFNLPENTEPNK